MENPKILIVDDSPEEAELAGLTLRQGLQPHETREAFSRQSYEKLLAEFRPDVIVCDYNMGNFTARDALAARDRLAPGVPLIIITGSLPDSEASDLLRAGAANFLSKEKMARLPAVVETTLHEYREKKSLQEQLFQSQKMEAMGRLAGGIAHDFNNILGAIEGYTSLLLNELDAGNPIRADIEEIRRAGQRGASLTKQLLLFSRKSGAKKAPLDPNAMICGLEQMLGRIIGDKHSISLDLCQDPLKVYADSSQLEQALTNLVLNARDSMPEGGTIAIATKRTYMPQSQSWALKDPLCIPPAMEISVRDSGAGMTAEVMSHLFEPFFTTKPKGKGTGLGLPIVYGIVRNHSGHVRAESQPGKGSGFFVCLPALDEGSEQLKK